VIALAYKAWRESAVRFLVGAAALAWFCAGFVLFRRDPGPAAQSYAGFVATTVHGGGIRTLFTLFALSLGFGGLRSERVVGSVGFTLALPVARSRLVLVRAALGLAEVAALAAVPGAVAAVLAEVVREPYPVADGLRQSAVWAAGGAAVFGLSFVISAIVEAPLAALALAAAALVGETLVFGLPGWASSMVTAAGAIGAAAWITERQDF
jgi:ABC-2 type transport system permease protein